MESSVKTKTVSYSQYNLYAQCPKKWKLDYLENRRVYTQSIFTLFGTAMHLTLQNYLETLYNKSVKDANAIYLGDYLRDAMFAEYKASLARNNNTHYSTPKELMEFHADGVAILNFFQKHRLEYFSTKACRLVGVEVALDVPLSNNISFTGFIDIVVFDEKTNRTKIYDIKTSTMGWNKYQKADASKIAQLLLYKEFYAKQYAIDVNTIDVEYIIVRRKINDSSEFVTKRIQTFIPASGKPTRNKLSKSFQGFLENCFTKEGTHNINGSYLAMQTSLCKYCMYSKEETLCPKKERIKS